MRTALFAVIGGLLLGSSMGCQCSTCSVPQMPIGDSLSMGGQTRVIWGTSDPNIDCSGDCAGGNCSPMKSGPMMAASVMAGGNCGRGCGRCSGGCGTKKRYEFGSTASKHLWNGHCESVACQPMEADCGLESAGPCGGCSRGRCSGGGCRAFQRESDRGCGSVGGCGCAMASGTASGGCGGGCGCGVVVPGGGGGCGCAACSGMIARLDHVRQGVASHVAANSHRAHFLTKTAQRCENGYCGGRPGPMQGAVNYPYYTTRGPRDFFHPHPPSIGP